jgi:hypothetical protein
VIASPLEGAIAVEHGAIVPRPSPALDAVAVPAHS